LLLFSIESFSRRTSDATALNKAITQLIRRAAGVLLNYEDNLIRRSILYKKNHAEEISFADFWPVFPDCEFILLRNDFSGLRRVPS